MISAGKENRYVKLYSKLSAEKKFRLEEGMFAVEGEKIILDAINENAELCCALVTEEAAMKYSKAVSFLEEKLKDRVLIISRETSEKLSDTKTPQGIFAVVKRLDKIFTGFFEKKGLPSDGRKSNMGIGLSVCAAIIQAHGGTIEAGNREGGGAVFRFFLEREVTDDEQQ